MSFSAIHEMRQNFIPVRLHLLVVGTILAQDLPSERANQTLACHRKPSQSFRRSLGNIVSCSESDVSVCDSPRLQDTDGMKFLNEECGLLSVATSGVVEWTM